jgi:hypothetical protein
MLCDLNIINIAIRGFDLNALGELSSEMVHEPIWYGLNKKQ